MTWADLARPACERAELLGLRIELGIAYQHHAAAVRVARQPGALLQHVGELPGEQALAGRLGGPVVAGGEVDVGLRRVAVGLRRARPE